MMEKGSSRTAPADTASVNVLRDSLGDRRASVTGVGQREGRGGQSKGRNLKRLGLKRVRRESH